ncbi:hypothetical protein MESS4_790127 [Mesorhizobium sp. STM 4661]|nr:hypothetical protein MESS4_790127 [Mesorhizobium sp. STM 4661]
MPGLTSLHSSASNHPASISLISRPSLWQTLGYGIALQRRTTKSEVFWALTAASQPSVAHYSALTHGNVGTILGQSKTPKNGGTGWWARRDSNPQPSGYEPPALTIELQAPHVAGLMFFPEPHKAFRVG